MAQFPHKSHKHGISGSIGCGIVRGLTLQAAGGRASAHTLSRVPGIPYSVQQRRFVEMKYKLSIGAAQNTQLSKALTAGSEKNIFVLPKVSSPPSSERTTWPMVVAIQLPSRKTSRGSEE
ncbi:hypothetical protein B0H14DRAFT_2635826 [Mycena olivaceomarginata]|nr:hypothetical protein B0H14DRAFT_2635826 [Mycena olivaceomarginata]